MIQSVDPALPVGLQVAVPGGGGVIGRHPDVVMCLPGSTVSRSHAQLEKTGGRWTLTPLTTSNAVFVGGRPVTAATVLENGVSFQLGGVVLVLVEEAGTTPVLERLDSPVLLEVQVDAGKCSVYAGGQLLPVAPSGAAVLGVLVEHAGKPVHRWDLLEVVGPNANLDKVVSKLRGTLREALRDGCLDASEVVALLGGGEEDLVKRLLVTRRGHGYLLALPPERVRRIVV